MRVALLSLIAAFGVAAAASAGPREVVDACARGGPDKLNGLANLEVACPGLTEALDVLGAGPLLAAKTREGLTRRKLTRVLDLATPAPKGAMAVPARASLDRILPTLASAQVKESWWERFKTWLRSHLKHGADEPKSSWLSAWIDKWTLSEAFRKGLFYALATLIVLAALAIIANEMRASGAFGERGGNARARAVSAPAGARQRRSLADVGRAPLSERAALMFSLVLQALADAGRLGAVRDRTHRELRREPPYADANERERFARLAEIAEEQLFAPTPVAAERISRALEDGEALIAALAHPAGNRA